MRPYAVTAPVPPLPLPFPDLHLSSGAARPGAGGPDVQGAVRVTAGGKHGTIGLDSASLVWTSSSSSTGAAANSSDATGCSSHSPPPDNSSCLDVAAPFVTVDGRRLEAVGFSDAIRLSAGRSFDLAVAGGGGVGENGAQESVPGEQSEGEAGEQEEGREKGRRSRLRGSGSTAALLSGDSGSLNASAGVVTVEVRREPTISKAEAFAMRYALSYQVNKGL